LWGAAYLKRDTDRAEGLTSPGSIPAV
jgi:hypothetical protein